MSNNPQHVYPEAGAHMSVHEYFRLDGIAPDRKYEYQYDAVRLMAGGSKEHDDIAFNTRALLKQEFLSGPCSVQGSDMRVQVSEAAYFYPDVTITCDIDDRRRGNKLIRSPHIVVEVLSPSTEKIDRGDKLKANQACPTIQEIVLIDQFAPHVEVYQRDEQNQQQWKHSFYTAGEEIVLESLDIAIPIDEVYRGIDFNEPLVNEL